MAKKESTRDNGPQRLQLTRNAGGHYAHETFTAEQAKASGIDEKHFQPFTESVTDRAVDAKDVTTR